MNWASLGWHEKPLGVLNVRGYYDPLLEMMKRSVEEPLWGLGDLQIICFQPLSHSTTPPLKMATRHAQLRAELLSVSRGHFLWLGG